MGLFSKFFGGNQQSEENQVSEDYQQAQDYVESQRFSGLTRHYKLSAVQDSIQRKTGIRPSPVQTVRIVNTVRRQNGWEPADYLEEE